MSEILLNQKVCPLLLNEGIGAVMGCLGERCQWWLPEVRNCTLPTIAQAMVALHGTICDKVGGTD